MACGAAGAFLELHIGTSAGRVSAAAGARPHAPPSSSSNMSSNEARFCLGRSLVRSHELMRGFKTRKQIHLAAFDAGKATDGDRRECAADCSWLKLLPIVLLDPPDFNPLDDCSLPPTPLPTSLISSQHSGVTCDFMNCARSPWPRPYASYLRHQYHCTQYSDIKISAIALTLFSTLAPRQQNKTHV